MDIGLRLFLLALVIVGLRLVTLALIGMCLRLVSLGLSLVNLFRGCRWLYKLAVRLGDSMVHPNGSGAVPPVLMCHGKADTMVQYRHGKASAKRLHDLGVRTSFRSYKGL